MPDLGSDFPLTVFPFDYIVYPVGSLNFKVYRRSDSSFPFVTNNASTADALTALQYARDQIGNPTYGGYVYLPPGDYPISNKLTFTGGTHSKQNWYSIGNGSPLGALAQIRPTTNNHGIELDGSTAAANGFGFSGIALNHNVTGYSSALFHILNSAKENTFDKISFYDSGKNVGDCFKFEITDTVAIQTQYSNAINRCIDRGFDNFVNINNQANTTTLGSFMSDLEVTNSKIWGAKRIFKVGGVSGAECLDFKFLNVDYQYLSGNAVTSGNAVFDMDSVVSCWDHKHTDVQVWDITAPGINYMNVGASCEVTLKGCSPSRMLGGSGLSTALPKIYITDWDRYRHPVPEFEGNILATYTATPIGTGLLLGTSFVGTPTQNADAHGPYISQPTGTTINTSVGYRKGPAMWRRDNNMYLAVKGSANNATLARYYVGWSTASPIPGSDTPLGTGDSGFLVGFRGTTDTNFQVFYNNGGGGAETIVDTGIPISTSADLIIIITCDSSGFKWSIGTGTAAPFTSITTGNLPGTTTAMVFHVIAQNNSTTSISYNNRWIAKKLRNSV